MGIRRYKPVTPGRRGASVSDFSDITDRNKKPEKSLLLPYKRTGGRNNQGFTCTRFRGGGHKRRYRLIDFKRNKDDIWAAVLSVEYDPNRSPRIALVEYTDGERRYVLAPDGLKAGDKIMSGEQAEPRVGNCLPLRRIPLGMTIHNLEMQPGRGGQGPVGIRLGASEVREIHAHVPVPPAFPLTAGKRRLYSAALRSGQQKNGGAVIPSRRTSVACRAVGDWWWD